MEYSANELREQEKSFENFKKHIKDKLDAHIIGLKNPFLAFDFKNLQLVKTPKSNYVNGEKTEYVDRIALSRLSRAIHEMFVLAMRMIEAGEKHKDDYEIIYSYPDKSEPAYKEYSSLKNEGIFILKQKDLYLPANLDETYTKKLLHELMLQAKGIRDNPKERMSNANNSRFFLLGEKGVGKTAFLNNIFSRYPSDLKKNEICWIRVDLTKDHFRKKTLLQAMNFQLVRIFREHYFTEFSNSEISDFKVFLTKEFYEGSLMDQKRFDTAYKDFADVFEEERTENYDIKIEKGIKDYVEKKYGLIYIYDGLDNIDNKKKYFEDKILEIQDILSNEYYHGVLIFVMRRESHTNYLLSTDDAHIRNSIKMFEIIPPKLDEIISKRIDLLFAHRIEYFRRVEVQLYYSGEKTEEEKNKVKEIDNLLSKFTKENYESYLNVFLLFLYKGITKDEDYIDGSKIKNWDKKETFEVLRDFFGYNYRLLLDIIKLTNEIFLEAIERTSLPIYDVLTIGYDIMNKNLHEKSEIDLNNIMKKAYLITNALLLQGNTSFKNPYIYEYLSNNKIRLKYNDNVKKPYIYNLYYSVNVIDVDEKKYYFLLKIRIMQYVSINKGESFTEDDIENFLNDMFNYSKEHIKIAFNELCENDLINKEARLIQKDDDNKSTICIYELSPKGENHFKFLISAFSYINLIIDDILIPKAFYDLFKVQYDDDTKKKVDYIIQQYPRLINFISMLYAFEKEEMESIHVKENDEKKWFISFQVYEKFIDTIAKVLWAYDRNLKKFNRILLNHNIS